LVCLPTIHRGGVGSSLPGARKLPESVKLVRMTKPNFASSHDWHVQLCCQRSELHPPKRAALDQGTNRHKARLRVLELGLRWFSSGWCLLPS
jgi:hypothetical protein